MRRLLFFLSTVAATLLLFAPAASAQEGTLRGRVSGQDGAALPGVQITVVGTNRGTVTDARGLYLVPGLPAGTYTVRAQSIGYSTGEASVTIPAGGSVAQNFVITQEALQMDRLTVTVGSRARVSAAEELTVPVDVFTRSDIVESVPQMEMGMVLQELSPAIYFPRAQIADITSGVRPFQLRGLSPDHSLVLVNGKRRHPTAVVHVFGAASGGSGSSGVDMNALIPSSLGGMEILRDGAAAQYGSDAIAGVIKLAALERTSTPRVLAAIRGAVPPPAVMPSSAGRHPGSEVWAVRGGGAPPPGFALSDRGTMVVSGNVHQRTRRIVPAPTPGDQVVAW